MNRDRHLPGLTPAYCRIELRQDEHGAWWLRVGVAETEGLWSGASWDSYGPLAGPECFDVVGAVLEGWNLI